MYVVGPKQFFLWENKYFFQGWQWWKQDNGGRGHTGRHIHKCLYIENNRGACFDENSSHQKLSKSWTISTCGLQIVHYYIYLPKTIMEKHERGCLGKKAFDNAWYQRCNPAIVIENVMYSQSSKGGNEYITKCQQIPGAYSLKWYSTDVKWALLLVSSWRATSAKVWLFDTWLRSWKADIL